MFTLIENNDQPIYGIKEFLCDEVSDIDSLPTEIQVGSMALVVEGTKIFILNNKKEWKEL